MILFQVSTHFQLICALIVRMQMVPDEEADLHLDDNSDFSGIIQGLIDSGLFHDIEFSNEMDECTKLRKGLGKSEYSQIEDIWRFQHEKPYTDVYFGHDAYPNKLYYYHLLNKGAKPRIHIMDEGMATYYKNIIRVAENDFIDHESFGEDSYIENVVEQLLFNPDLYCLKDVPWTVTRLPYVSEETGRFLVKLYHAENYTVPSEPYIYLASGGYEEGYFTNEVDLLNKLAEVVGRDQIIIKTHPRHNLDIFSKFGFKIWKEEGAIPWEIYLLNNDTSNQVFVTVFSNAVLSPHNLLGREQKILFLYNMFWGNTRYNLFGRNVKASFTYLSKIMEFGNAEKRQIFNATTDEALHEMLVYLEGTRRGKEDGK